MWQIAPGWFAFFSTNLQIEVCEFLRYQKKDPQLTTNKRNIFALLICFCLFHKQMVDRLCHIPK